MRMDMNANYHCWQRCMYLLQKPQVKSDILQQFFGLLSRAWLKEVILNRCRLDRHKDYYMHIAFPDIILRKALAEILIEVLLLRY